MKPSKLLLYALAVGTMTFAANQALAVLGEVTVSGKAYYQDNDSHGYPIVKTVSIKQTTVLSMLADALDESSIADKKTKLLWDPDEYNDTAYYSYYGIYYYGELPTFMGRFYVTNSTLGLYPLDGTDYYGDYFSYVELNSAIGDAIETTYFGFFSPYTTEYNYVEKAKESSSSGSINIQGNAIFYIHYNPYNFGINYYYNDSTTPQQYYANEYYGTYQDAAMVFRGATTFNAKGSSSKVTEQLTMKNASGEGLWYTSGTGTFPIVVNGQLKFSAKGSMD